MIDMYKWVLNLQRGLSDVSGQVPSLSLCFVAGATCQRIPV